MDNTTLSQSTTKVYSLQKVHYDLPFTLLCILAIVSYLKPEFIIPGLSSIRIVRQIPNLLVGMLFILWLLQGRKVFHNEQTKLYISFFFLLIIDTIFARNQGLAFLVSKGAILGVMKYLATISFVNTFSRLKKLIMIFLFCNILIALLGIKGGGLIRTVPSLCDENDFALLMNMLIPFVFFLGIEAKELRKKYFYFTIAGLFTTGVVVSFSRGGFVGLSCTLLYCCLKTKKKSFAILLAIVIALLAYSFVPQTYWEEIKTIQTEGAQKGTGQRRIYLWKNALKIFADHPILGVGPYNSGVWMTTYDETEQGARDWGRALHSIYFTLLSELGLVGTFLFFAIIYYGEKNKKYIKNTYNKNIFPLMNKIKTSEPYKIVLSKQIRDSYFLSLALTGSLIGYLSSGIFLSVLYYSWFWMIMTYTVILFNLTKKSAVQIINSSDTKMNKLPERERSI